MGKNFLLFEPRSLGYVSQQPQQMDMPPVGQSPESLRVSEGLCKQVSEGLGEGSTERMLRAWPGDGLESALGRDGTCPSSAPSTPHVVSPLLLHIR